MLTYGGQRRSRARAIVRGTRAKNVAFAALRQAVNFAKKAAPYARRAGAKSTLARKIGLGFRKAPATTIPAIAGRVRNNLNAVTQELATLRAKAGVAAGTQTRGRTSRYRSSNISGKYTGLVLPKYKKPRANKYDLYGATHENETAGTNTMLHCNYIGFQSVRPYEFGRLIGMAVMRHVMKKHYMVDYASPLQKLLPTVSGVSMTNGATGIPYSFVFEWEQSAGATTNVGSVAFTPASGTNNDTLASFGTWFSTNVFNSQSFGGVGGSGTRVWRWLRIQEQIVTNGGVVVTQFVKAIPIDKMRVEGYSIAKMTLQNSTVSDSNSSSIDVIDANPLRGKIYKLNSLAPSINQTRYTTVGDTVVDNWDDLATSTPEGVVLPASDPPQAWRAPPKPTMFDRVKGYASLNFEPGESKEFQMKFYFKGNINYLIQNLNQSGGALSAAGLAVYANRYNKVLGECTLIALEKRIKGESAVPLVLNYHIDHYAGAVVTGFARTRIDREFISVEKDNDPA